MPIYLGQTIRLKHIFYDFEGNVAYPSNHSITVTDPHGNVIYSSTSPSQQGDYYLVSFTIPATAKPGNYKAKWEASSGDYNWIATKTFAVQTP